MLKVYVPYLSVVFGREVLGEVIGKVFSSLLPLNTKLILLDAATHPVETHAKGFGALLAHVSGEDAVGGLAVGFIGVCGCGWTISMRAVRMGKSCWT